MAKNLKDIFKIGANKEENYTPIKAMVSSPDPGMRAAKRKMKYEQYMSQNGMSVSRRQSEIADDDTKDTKNQTFAEISHISGPKLNF